VLVPVKTPPAIGWVMMAFPLDPQLALDLRNLSGLDLALVARADPASPWFVLQTSLDTVRAASVLRAPWTGASADDGVTAVSTPDGEARRARGAARRQAGGWRRPRTVVAPA
jgi:hypothetical protein